MREITDEEYENLLVNGCGVIHFMGGCGAKEGRPTVVCMSDGRLILFEPEEVDNEEYQKLMKEQAEESKDFCETFTENIKTPRINKAPIFIVTMVRYALNQGTRPVGFFHEFETAEEDLVNNSLDVNEGGYYPYAVIEEVPIGFYAMCSKEIQWYKWNRDQEKYEPIDKPDKFNHICGWGLG